MPFSEVFIDHSDEEQPCIYCAAKDGYPQILYTALTNITDAQLRNYIANLTISEIDRQSYTPLGVAAKYGRFDVVKMLLDLFAVDIERQCTVKIEGVIVMGATALWCAARSGHLDIVKLLIRHGAIVNHLTNPNLQPLRAACINGNIDVVRYLINHGANVQTANDDVTCLMIAAFKGYPNIVELLLSVGANPNDKRHRGDTALHYAAESNLIDICRILLNYDAELIQNEFGLTAPMLAAIKSYEEVVELFINHGNYLTKTEKIAIFELLGASFCCNKMYNCNLNKAYHYMEIAMKLRYEDPDEIIYKQITPSSYGIYDGWKETEDMSEFQVLDVQREQIFMESLAARERILGKQCPDLTQPICNVGLIFAEHGQYKTCINLWMYAARIRQQLHRLSISLNLNRFAQFYSQLFFQKYEFILEDFLDVLQLTYDEITKNLSNLEYVKSTQNPNAYDMIETINTEYERNIIIVFNIITILANTFNCEAESLLYPEKYRVMHQLIVQIVQLQCHLNDGQTLLHLAVNANSYTPHPEFYTTRTNFVCTMPCLSTVKLLLKCGCSLNAIDNNGNTPLHILTATLQNSLNGNANRAIYNFADILKVFIHYNVHLDAVNKSDLTASEICLIPEMSWLVKIMKINSMTLQCLAARSIAANKIPFKTTIPQHLHAFIEEHSLAKPPLK